jgi:uncharacterized protein (DUF1800 family)
MDARTAHVLIRFGLGRRGTESLPDDPIRWLARQLDGPDPALVVAAPSTADGLRALALDRHDFHTMGGQAIRRVNPMYKAQFAAIIANLLTTQVPFRERLVWFWANHFTISLRYEGELEAVAPGFLREAIRPHVTGTFADMLLAVMQHPAMLMYLDNVGSVGPNSGVGRTNHHGMNENLARESLELHTVSEASGYTQQDIIEYAKMLTGWSVTTEGPTPGFLFRPAFHEPGPKTLLGRTFPPGFAGGMEAVTWLGHHPMTYRHLATKLVRHFVADSPPPAAVHTIETVLQQSGGNLRAASLALTALPEAWQPLTKLRDPIDYVLAVLRALDQPTVFMPEFDAISVTLGQSLLLAPLPNGFPDTEDDWDSGEQLLRRVDWVYRLAPRFASVDAAQLARDSLGDLLSAETLAQVSQAGSRRDALALLLSSPEFLRR